MTETKEAPEGAERQGGSTLHVDLLYDRVIQALEEQNLHKSLYAIAIMRIMYKVMKEQEGKWMSSGWEFNAPTA